jgi:hypothetical protein
MTKKQAQAGGVAAAAIIAGAVLTHEGAPEILSQPEPAAQQVAWESHVRYEVKAEGNDLVYQWRLNGEALPDQTNAVIELPYVRGTNAGNYSVVVSNDSGSVTSQLAFLVVDLYRWGGFAEATQQQAVQWKEGANEFECLFEFNPDRIEYTTNESGEVTSEHPGIALVFVNGERIGTNMPAGFMRQMSRARLRGLAKQALECESPLRKE